MRERKAMRKRLIAFLLVLALIVSYTRPESIFASVETAQENGTAAEADVSELTGEDASPSAEDAETVDGDESQPAENAEVADSTMAKSGFRYCRSTRCDKR